MIRPGRNLESSSHEISTVRSRKIEAILLITITIVSSISLTAAFSGSGNAFDRASAVPAHALGLSINRLAETYVGVPYAPGSISHNVSGIYNGPMSVIVTFKLTNESRLTTFLSDVSNPASPLYRDYMSHLQSDCRLKECR